MRQHQDNPLPEKIARIKPAHSRPTEWAPTTDKDESHPDGAKTQRKINVNGGPTLDYKRKRPQRRKGLDS